MGPIPWCLVFTETLHGPMAPKVRHKFPPETGIGPWMALPRSESVKCRFSKCRFSVLNLKFDFISDGGCTREKQIQKALGSLPPCGNRCRFSESAICSSRVHPPSEIKSNFIFKTLRWRPLRWRLTLSDQTHKFRAGTEPYTSSKPTNAEEIPFPAGAIGIKNQGALG